MKQEKQFEKNIKGLVLTLRPDNAQKLLLDKHLNDTRFIYNQYVEEYLNCIKENRLPDYKDYKDLCAEHEFLKGSCSWTLQHVLYRFKQTNKINRSKRSKGQKVGLVKFRSKKSHSDYFYTQGVKLSYNLDCKSKILRKNTKDRISKF